MEDILIKKFFEKQRWLDAIEKGVVKGIDQNQLRELTTPRTRADIYLAMRDGGYHISPPHIALIPKDTPGEWRTVYINEPVDRIVLSIANDLLFEMCADMVHPACKSYRKGTGCGRVVQEAAGCVCASEGSVAGWKSDLSKYFDSVPVDCIDRVFDKVEQRVGKSVLTDILREYYHCNLYFERDNTLHEKYQSLRQGSAVASFLADACLYEIDEALSSLNGFYARYSDDMLFIGPDKEKAMKLLRKMLSDLNMSLNPKKVKDVTMNEWFTFLGFAIKGHDITLSPNAVKNFQKEIQARTVKDRTLTPDKALRKVTGYLYRGRDGYCWATRVLPIINVKEDIDTLNMFVMDSLRAVATRHRKTGGLGWNPTQKRGCIARGTGANVKANRERTEARIEGFRTLNCMRNALLTSRAVFDTLASSM